MLYSAVTIGINSMKLLDKKAVTFYMLNNLNIKEDVSWNMR